MEFKMGQRIRVTEADPEIHDSDVGQTGVIVLCRGDSYWIRMDEPTRYPHAPDVAIMPDGRALTNAQDGGYCDCISGERLELIPFEPFSRVRVNAPGSPFHELCGITLDADETPWVRFDKPCVEDQYAPTNLCMPDGRQITQERDGAYCMTMVVDDLVLDETEDEGEDVLPPGARVRRTTDGQDSFAGMTGTVHGAACGGTARWVRFDQPTLYKSVPSDAAETDAWHFDLVSVFQLEAIESN